MKSLLFHELLLLSRVERRARRVPFHPKATVIRGKNGTGKSSILKSLYSTMGAEAVNIQQRWKTASVISAVTFSVDGVFYRMVRNGDVFAVFNADGQLQRAFTRVTVELAPYIADLFSFHLLLQSRNGEAQATPAFLYLPFYIDQDRGWVKAHDGFDRLEQFKSPRKDMIQFHAGIRPTEYYVAKANAAKATANAKPFIDERAAVARVLEDVDNRIAKIDFDVSLSDYDDEIVRLLDRCNALRGMEERRKRELTSAFIYRRDVEENRVIIEKALEDLRADRRFAATKGNIVVCPTCHATYENGFAERFEIALDEDTCIELLDELSARLSDATSKWEAARDAAIEAGTAVSEVEAILNAKRGDVRLIDILQKEGQKDVSRSLREEIGERDRQIGQFEGLRRDAEDEMRRFEDRKRQKTIEDFYRGEIDRLLLSLDVTTISRESVRRMDAKIKESGSHLPRALLAYYFALVRTIHKYSSSTFCPLVIDSPHQQDQDQINWTRILTCIRDERPESSQLVLATTTDTGFDFGGSTIDLTEKSFVLQEDQFDEANEELRPLLDSIGAAVRRRGTKK